MPWSECAGTIDSVEATNITKFQLRTRFISEEHVFIKRKHLAKRTRIQEPYVSLRSAQRNGTKKSPIQCDRKTVCHWCTHPLQQATKNSANHLRLSTLSRSQFWTRVKSIDPKYSIETFQYERINRVNANLLAHQRLIEIVQFAESASLHFVLRQVSNERLIHILWSNRSMNAHLAGWKFLSPTCIAAPLMDVLTNNQIEHKN